MRRQLLCSCGEFRRMVLEDEMSFKEVGNRFGVSYGTVQRYAKQYLTDEERKAVAARSHRETGARFGGTGGGGHAVIERDDAPNFFQRLEAQKPKLTMKRTIIAFTGEYAQYSVNYNENTVTIVNGDQDMTFPLEVMDSIIRELGECKGILEGTIQA